MMSIITASAMPVAERNARTGRRSIERRIMRAAEETVRLKRSRRAKWNAGGCSPRMPSAGGTRAAARAERNAALIAAAAVIATEIATLAGAIENCSRGKLKKSRYIFI